MCTKWCDIFMHNVFPLLWPSEIYFVCINYINTGCTVDSLLDTDRDPECSKRGDMCTCTVMSSDGRYGMMYDGTSVGSTAHLFTNNSYCYNRPQILERTCQDNDQWSGETVDPNNIFTG